MQPAFKPVKEVAALFVMEDSHYKTLPGVDCYDINRDARTYRRSLPVVAHRPCRAWGRLSHLAKPRPDEKELAFFAVEQVQRNGGVLEHPSASRLFDEAGLPRPGTTHRDSHGGFSFPLSQKWFGHPCEKRTWLYVVGIEPAQLPDFPLDLAAARQRIGADEGSKRDRMVTPPQFAKFLIDIARSVN